MKLLKLLLLLFSFNGLFAYQLLPLGSGYPTTHIKKNNNSIELSAITKTLSKKDINNLERTVLYKGQPIIIHAGYLSPVDVKFPAFIEKIEYMEGQGGIYIYKKDFMNGTQTLRILRKKFSKVDNIIYVTILGKKIPLIVKYPVKGQNDHLVNINIPKNLLGLSNKPLVSNDNFPRVVKITKYKNLSFKTNIKSVIMILKMINGTAKNYYQEINLNYKPIGNNSSFSSFFGTKNPTKEEYLSLLFKKVFRGNKNFMTAYFNNEIIPQKLFVDNYEVYLTNKRKAQLKIFGVKTKWCNFSNNTYKEINIDDIKLVFGKDILAAFHSFKKIPPKHCSEVYTVFYSLKGVNYNSLINY